MADPLQRGDARAEEQLQYVRESLQSKELMLLPVAYKGESFKVRH